MKIFFALLFTLGVGVLSAQALDSEKGSEYALASMNVQTDETKALSKDLSSKDGLFGLESYEKSFFLPLSYSKDKPPRTFTASPANIVPSDFNPTYDSKLEMEYQFSLKKQLTYDLFGMNEFIYIGYTQRAWWQAYMDSAPFRETNYRPELYGYFPLEKDWDEAIGLKALQVGFVHESNGQEGFKSRSWNRIYATGHWQFDNLFISTRAWYKIPESDKNEGYNDPLSPNFDPNDDGDDNPDIDEYIGYGDIKINYLYGKSQIGMLLRNNLRFNSQNKGAIEFNYLYPIAGSNNTFWYAEVFHGYGQSLIDYNREVTKIAVGFAFSRGMF